MPEITGMPRNGALEMWKRKFLIYVLLTLFASSVLGATNFPLVAEAQSTTTVYVDPELTVALLDSTVSINISIAAVEDLCSWQVYVYFLNQILEAKEYAEGPFLKSCGPTMFDGGFNNAYNTTHGEVWMWCLRAWSGSGVNGSGTLASVTLKAKSGGSSPLNLVNTILGNSTAQRISHVTADGMIEVGGSDIAITSVVPCKTIVGQDHNMKVNVTIENQGNYTETFNITTYANTTIIDTLINLTLTSGNSKTVTFTWSTTGFAKGNYTISAYAWPLPGETDTEDNTHMDGTVYLGIPGDINGDGSVDIFDAILLSGSFGSALGGTGWNPDADINGDEMVDIFDAIILSSNFGKSEP